MLFLMIDLFHLFDDMIFFWPGRCCLWSRAYFLAALLHFRRHFFLWSLSGRCFRFWRRRIFATFIVFNLCLGLEFSLNVHQFLILVEVLNSPTCKCLPDDCQIVDFHREYIFFNEKLIIKGIHLLILNFLIRPIYFTFSHLDYEQTIYY